MEPNTSSSSAAGTSHAAVVLEHGEFPARDPSLLSPAFSPAPSPGLLPASGSGSESSSYEQIPAPAAVAPLGNGSLSVDAHATSSSSSHSVPSSPSFPTAGGTLPMVGYDLFGNPKGTAAETTLFGGLWDCWEQGGSSSSPPSSVLPECLSPNLFGFAGDEYTAWPSEEMSPFFFSPWSGGGLAPQSSDNMLSSDSEMEPLLQSLPSIPSPAVEESPVVDAPQLPIQEEEEIDVVSAFLVSDPEDQLPNAYGTATPQMASGGGEASASWMAPGSTGNNWPVMLTPPAVSTGTMVSTSSGSMACHSGGSSIGVTTSSIGGIMKPSSPVLPLIPQSSHGAGASSSKYFNRFAPQPSSSSVVAPLEPNLQGPLLPVKQEVMEYVGATARRPPEFISLVDDDEDGLYPDAMPRFFPGPVFYPPVPEKTSPSRGSLLPLGSNSGQNVFGSWGGSISSPASFAPGSCPGSSSIRPSFAPSSWGGGSSSRPSLAPSSWGGGDSSCPSFAPSSWASSSSGIPSFAPRSWASSSSSPNITGSTPCFDRSTSIDNYDSSSMSKLSIRGKMPAISLRPRAGRPSGSNGGAAGIVFTDHEMAIITKDKKLQELLKTDPKKVKRILYNRTYSAMAKVRRVKHTKDLERLIVTLEEKRKSLCEELESLEEGSAALMAEKKEMQKIIGELQRQTMLKDAVREGLRAEIQKLNRLKFN